jgi:hypothetical protein
MLKLFMNPLKNLIKSAILTGLVADSKVGQNLEHTKTPHAGSRT